MTIDQLRAAAVAHTLFTPTTLPGALRRLGFVQADPIRAPARAQDLILRHRVQNYHAGDLERRYPKLAIEEGVLYAYGFLSDTTFSLLHSADSDPGTQFEQRVLTIVREHGPLHPNDMRRWFGRDRVLNDWGGQSLQTTRTLEHLRRRGLIRIARRDAGVRVYEASAAGRLASPASQCATAAERVRALLRIVIAILGPIPERTLSGIAARFTRKIPAPGGHRAIMKTMLREGEFRREEIDGLAYWLASRSARLPDMDCVRFLAPFDPIVWDRRRFEHVWGWPYRFEAYVPVEARVRGYYALPLLWRTQVIGWVNVPGSRQHAAIDAGFVGARPKDRAFARALRDEVDCLRAFLEPRRP